MIGRGLIVTVLCMFVVSMLIMRNITRSASGQNDNMVRYSQRVLGRDVAQGGINMALRKLANSPSTRASFTANISGAYVTVTFRDTFFMARPAVKIASSASVPFLTGLDRITTSDSLFTCAVFVPRGILPSQILKRGALTSNENVNAIGNTTIDGRDHDTSGVYDPIVNRDQGTFAVWTMGPWTANPSVARSGTTIVPSDIGPINQSPQDSAIIRQNQTTGLPGTPDSVLGGASHGYPPGTLKAIAQSGVAGSRYYNSSTIGSLTNPPFLSGVTYVELDSAGQWPGADITGSGILVVHNAWKNSVLSLPGGTFKGLIIIDDSDKLHATVIGAMLILKSGTALYNAVANGGGGTHAQIYYSTAAIALALSSVKADTAITTYTNKILGWWE